MITTRHKLTRYGSSLVAVLAVHAVAIAIALHWSSSPPPPLELPPAAMIVEMPPMPEPTPTPPPKVVQPPPPAPVEEPPLPKVAEAPKPTIALPKPPPKPKPKPQPPKPEKKPELPPEKPVVKQVEEAAPAPAAPVAAKKADPAPPMASNPDAMPSWQADLLRHLAKFKRYPDDARRRGLEGTAKLRFVVDADGNVLSFDLVGTSGSAALDRATLEMIRRAQPLPKPPRELLVNGQREITAPFVYTLDKRR